MMVVMVVGKQSDKRHKAYTFPGGARSLLASMSLTRLDITQSCAAYITDTTLVRSNSALLSSNYQRR